MPIIKKLILCAAVALQCLCAIAQEGNDTPSPADMAEKEVSRLETALKLEDWQVFYVDSTLVHDYTGWMDEIQELSKARVENRDLYIAVQDKWMERIEASYRKFFTDAQWQDYLKQGGERIIKDRQKRRDKAAGIKPEKKKKKK